MHKEPLGTDQSRSRQKGESDSLFLLTQPIRKITAHSKGASEPSERHTTRRTNAEKERQEKERAKRRQRYSICSLLPSFIPSLIKHRRRLAKAISHGARRRNERDGTSTPSRFGRRPRTSCPTTTSYPCETPFVQRSHC